MGKLADVLMQWAQLTKENEEEWAADVNILIPQGRRYSGVQRASCCLQFILSCTIHTFVQCVVTEADQAQGAGIGDWWRPLTGAFAVLASQSELIHDAGRPGPIDCEYLLVQVIPSLPTLSDCCLSVSTRLLSISRQPIYGFAAHVCSWAVDSAVHVLESNETDVPFKVSAVKSI
ncbi:hypothetical protein BJV78DRAFT_260741 [Lactifluus subvellereus]|nr:hypothetical protein BJV78DRAFT_260741 [Lactifluus subvellereus]